MTRIKICGITNKADAVDASGLGVDMLGFVFYKKSKRYVEPEVVIDIVNQLPPFITRVGIFVDEVRSAVSEIAETCSLDMLQFHGKETPGYCDKFMDFYKVIKAFRIKDKDSLNGVNKYSADFYMLDAYSAGSAGGTGRSFDWDIISGFEFLRPVILSGGLTPANVAQAIGIFSPYGVDVSSGVEKSPGRKDLNLMKRFVENVRKI
jgi:phosphoribosylanthranilate isomerase